MKILIPKMCFPATALLLTALFCFSFAPVQDKKKPWVVPDASKNAKNPAKGDKTSIEAGKVLYEKHCKSCHGLKGLGDGPKSKELETSCGDFTTKEFKAETDGELFFTHNAPLFFYEICAAAIMCVSFSKATPCSGPTPALF